MGWVRAREILCDGARFVDYGPRGGDERWDFAIGVQGGVFGGLSGQPRDLYLLGYILVCTHPVLTTHHVDRLHLIVREPSLVERDLDAGDGGEGRVAVEREGGHFLLCPCMDIPSRYAVR